ncbi:hypothetical protein C0Q70_02918 [Pomacea canaliculata]|uniref:Uncharacterized protein n=2 Tax=Pomacea canaliculata TaxID=400727 RepID=A0A2T7PRA1_POMCA|nr:acid-sensing ion channel 5-like isoform X2 [Pomacea canaliculata]XP_025081675.1 acid-sensing ion channel 5-like isoform X2 [Pomacea canaliculata]PVD35949.1 hypothetical protein C0Q70_02918 [Pomacea canaliculata]
MDEKATSALPMQNLSESTPNKGRTRKSISPSLNPVEEDAGEAAVKDLLVYYARHSTMHGIPSIVGSRLYRGRRVFWIGVVCVMAILLVTVIYWQMSDFYRFPTVTSVNVRYVTENDFPAVTICDLNVFNKQFIEQLDIATQMRMTYLTEIPGIFHLVGKVVLDTLRQRHNVTESSHQKDEETVASLLKMTQQMIEVDGGGLYCAWSDHYWENCSVAMDTRVTDMGVCFTVDSRKLVKDTSLSRRKASTVSNALRGLSLIVTTASEDIPYRLYHSEGFKVVLHDPEEEPLPQSRGFIVGANRSVEVEIRKNVRIGLEPPFKAFGSGTCVEVCSSSFVNPLKRFARYTKEACEMECFVDYVVDYCHCRHFLHPGNETICPLKQLATCFREAEDLYFGGKNKSQPRCDCPLPCRENVYSTSVTYASFRTTALFDAILPGVNESVVKIHFYFPDPVVTTIEQIPVYSLEGLLGSIGGQVGLFMGFSLVTVAEMCELVFLLITRGRRFFAQPEARRPLNQRP